MISGQLSKKDIDLLCKITKIKPPIEEEMYCPEAQSEYLQRIQPIWELFYRSSGCDWDKSVKVCDVLDLIFPVNMDVKFISGRKLSKELWTMNIDLCHNTIGKYFNKAAPDMYKMLRWPKAMIAGKQGDHYFYRSEVSFNAKQRSIYAAIDACAMALPRESIFKLMLSGIVAEPPSLLLLLR